MNLAVIAVGLTAALRQLLQPLLGEAAPLLVFVLPVGAVALYCGLGPGIVTTLLSAVLANFLFINEVGFTPLDQARMTVVMIFLAVGFRLTALADRLPSASKSTGRLGHTAG